jgi:hypothetical protein
MEKLVVSGTVIFDASIEIVLRNTPKLSTTLIQQADFGVKCNAQRG